MKEILEILDNYDMYDKGTVVPDIPVNNKWIANEIHALRYEIAFEVMQEMSRDGYQYFEGMGVVFDWLSTRED